MTIKIYCLSYVYVGLRSLDKLSSSAHNSTSPSVMKMYNLRELGKNSIIKINFSKRQKIRHQSACCCFCFLSLL